MTTNAGADECGWEPFPPLPIIIYEANSGLREWLETHPIKPGVCIPVEHPEHARSIRSWSSDND